MTVELFLFVCKFICIIFFLDSTDKQYHVVFVFLLLTYFTKYIISRSIHIAANGIILFFLLAE